MNYQHTNIQYMNQSITKSLRYKISLFILCVVIPCIATAQNKGEKVTIQSQSISLKGIFKLIEQQTIYSIAYEQSALDLDKEISISIKEADVSRVLRVALKHTKHTYKIKGYHIIVYPSPLKKEIKHANRPTQTIKGLVIDVTTEQPLASVLIGIMNEPKLSAISDSLGHFIIRNVPIGRYDIKASCFGYKPYLGKELVVISAKELVLNISLKEHIHQLAEVIVHPNIDKETALNPMALTGGRVLTVEEASRFAGGFDDPARLVSSFAGVAGGVNTNALAVRGNAPQFTQWRLEGIEVSTPTHYADMTGLGGGLLTGLSSNVLGNSDFFNGAFPAEYNNSLAGVFDMSMRTGNNQNYEHAFQVGLWGLDLASEGPISKKHKSSYLFNYRYSFSGLSDAISGASEGLDYQDLSFKLNFPTKRAGLFTVWGLGLLDKVIQKGKENPKGWEYASDKQNTDNRFTKGMFGIGHKIYCGERSYVKTSLATTYAKVHAIIDQADEKLVLHRMANMLNSNMDIILKSYLHSKISKKHANRTGVTITRMNYDLDFKISDMMGLYKPMQQIAKGDHADFAFSAFTSSVYNLHKNVDASIGLTGQYFSLNNHWTLEPRLSVKWKLPKKQTLSFAYGLNSSRSRLDYYYVKTTQTGDRLINKNLDFSKAHHISLSYRKRITDNMNLKIEPYFQYLYNIPVEANSSFSILNYNGYGLDKALVNKGEGRNYGIDLTLERYINNGWYALLTGSLFKSEYMGGDNVWRNTRMDQRFITNGLIGKEWVFGKRRHKIFSANVRLTYQGGCRYTPFHNEDSQHNQGITEDETQAYSLRLPNSFTTDITLRYRINKKRIAHEFSFMILNANGFKQTGYAYNIITNAVEKKRYAPIVPSISWKIYF